MNSRRKRKILLVLEATLGGTGKHILDVARGLLDHGDIVHLVFSRKRADEAFSSRLKELRSYSAEFHSEEIPIARPVVFGDFAVIWRLWTYVRKHGPFDVIHGHSTKAGFLVRLLPSMGDAQMVYTPHALMTMHPNLQGFRRFAVRTLESMLAWRSAAVVVTSEEERRCALVTGIRASKLVFIENGLDLASPEFQLASRPMLRKQLALRDDAVCIGFVGRLCDDKQPHRLLDAFALLRGQTAVPVKLAIVGSGPLEPELQNRIAQLGMQSDIVWLGPAGKVPMMAFDILAHTSLSEGLSYVFLEALAAGIPIVTTRVGGVEEVIERLNAGLVCDPWVAEKFAGLLRVLVENSELRSSLSRNAKRGSLKFDRAHMVDLISTLYDSIAKRATVSPDASLAGRLRDLEQ